jgi:hypothetical protein
MISKVLRDLTFTQSHPLKLTDDWDIGILENELMKLKKRR